MGFAGYFLIVRTMLKQQNSIPVGQVGSGGGSLVAYALVLLILTRYTRPLFERFLNPERVSMPDFTWTSV